MCRRSGAAAQYGPTLEIDYGAGQAARIDGTVGDSIAVELESRVSKQVRGAVMDLDVIWALSRVWYAGRADADWRGRSADEAQAVVDSVGLEGEFWNFSPEMI